MSFVGLLILAIVALLAGWLYNWGVPRIQPSLPAVLSSNLLWRSLVTGIFILVVVWVANFVVHAVRPRRA